MLGVMLAGALAAPQAGSIAALAQGARDTGPPAAFRIETPQLILGAPASEASLDIRIIPAGPLPANSYIRVRGLPQQAALSEGHAIAPGAWAVPLVALEELRIVIPTGLSGRSEVSIALVTVDGGTLAEARANLVISGAALTGVHTGLPSKSRGAATFAPPRALPEAAPPPRTATPSPLPSPPAARAPQPPVSPAPPAPAGPEFSPEQVKRAQGFLARGRALLDGGDIAGARLVFQRAAEGGLWQGAIALGTTYDPVELDRRRAVGIRADVGEARRWYERARQLGAGAVADQHLSRLPAQ